MLMCCFLRKKLALNGWYLHAVNDEEEKRKETDTWLDSLPSDKKDSVKRKSCELIFDKNYADNDWKYVQTTFWELRTEQIMSVRRFSGCGKDACHRGNA